MINKIFIHVGVHKTGSTSIQEKLGENRHILEAQGFLYPEFYKRNILVNNHSIVFYSLFCERPENYHINIASKLTRPKQIEKLHSKYKSQLIKQINDFKGHSLIISGEDISALNPQQLINLKTFLVELTGKKTEIRIIMFCRHPVSWTASHILQLVKGGRTVERAIYLTSQLHSNYYKSRIQKFSDVFSKDAISLFRYEDALRHENGLEGFFLGKISFKNYDLLAFNKKHYNTSQSYEATILLSAVYSKFPLYVDNQNNPELSYGIRNELNNLPGRKFVFPEEDKLKIWQASETDCNHLCSAFQLDNYSYNRANDADVSKYWDDTTLTALKGLLPKCPENVRMCIIDAIQDDLNKYKDYFDKIKIEKILNLIKINRKGLESATYIGKLVSNYEYLGMKDTIIKVLFNLKLIIRKLF